ncbi:major facilitator superfamily domain-containing protein 12-like [Venturia canescens]|uniref:major facilitator superfamily domain-containing protein 12-like n=1 Tax=Venturia canescens TaxID=32260 RepID=UPI001C9BE508|nr:major facilitator superfamily domain-containing protein 12-like [Venturia canescens]
MENSGNSVENDYTEIVRLLTRKQKFAYGVGHVLNDICASMWFTYLIVYFHYVLGFSAVLSGVVLFIGQVADALATPFVGIHSDINDDFWLCKYGRRKTWHLLGTVCVIFSFPFIFSRCAGCENTHHWAQLFYYAAFVIIFQFGWASVQISHLSLIPDLTPTKHERIELTAIRYTFTVFSNVLVYCITWGILHITSDSPDVQIGPADAPKFQTIMLIGLSVGFVTSLVFHLMVREGQPDVSSGHSRRTTKTASALLKDIQLYKVAGVYMPTRLFLNISQIYVPLYLHESLHLPATRLAIIPLAIFISSFVTSLIIERLNTKLGRKISYTIGVVLGVLGCTWIWFGSGQNYTTYEIYPVSILLGASGAIMLVTSLGTTSDLIGENTESGAFVYGAMSFTDKLSNGLFVMAIQYIRCDKSCPMYYRDILTFVCGGSAVFGFFMMLLIKAQPTGDEFADYRTLEGEEQFATISEEPMRNNEVASNASISSRQEL